MAHGSFTTGGLIVGIMVTAATAALLSILLHVLGVLHEPAATLFVVFGSNAMGVATYIGIAESYE